MKAAASVALLAALHATLLATPVLAQQVGQAGAAADAVVLKDGGVIRGTLVQLAPGDHATIQLPTGQTATVRWDVIQRIERSGQPVSAATAGAPPAVSVTPLGALAPVAPTVSSDRVFVHLDASGEVRLQVQQGGWISVCHAPCDMEVPLDATYRIAGNGIRPSRTFRLAATRAGERVVIVPTTGSTGGLVGGIVLVSLGAPIAIVGLLTLLIVSALDAQRGYRNTDPGKTVGWTLFGLGAGMTTGGALLIGTNKSTTIEQLSEGAARPAPAARAPSWREVSSAELPAQPGFSVPFLTGSF